MGAWPIDEARALTYLQKASKEAKEHTSWTDPNRPRYDAGATAVRRRGVLGDEAFRPTSKASSRRWWRRGG